MMEESERSSDNLKKLTIAIREHFSSENVNHNAKWLLLKDYYSKFLLRKDFNATFTASYAAVLSTLLDSLRPNLFTQKWEETLFDDVFLRGIQHEAFLILVKGLKKDEKHARRKIIDLLLKFARGSSLEAMLFYQCISTADWDLKYVSKFNFWEYLITVIVSVPERIANQTNGQFMKIFTPSSYVPLLLYSMFKVLSRVHERLGNSQDCSLEFLAKLTGRLCTTGNAAIVAKKFSRELIHACEKDFIWRRISKNFILKMPSSCLDSFIANLLLAVPWYGYVEWILDDEGAKNEKILYIMTVKLLFCPPFKQDIILQNIIGYFASSSSRVSHFISVLDSLLDSWVDDRALSHQNIEQKTYLASALMVCAGWVMHLKLSFENKDYVNKVVRGTQIRLGSSEEIVRSLGMIVGEHMIKAVEPNSPPLKFEFSDTVVLDRLKNLLGIPSKPVDDLTCLDDLKCFEEIEVDKSPSVEQVSNATEPLDSDDDLEPYNLGNDLMQADAKRPFYIRECMKGLVERENVQWTEQCLKQAEQLIKHNAYATQEVAEEMAKIVLHFDDSLAIPDLAVLRHRILIALTVQCPVVVSSYLTSQLAEKDYTIRQRLDILEVLASSCALLSRTPLPHTPATPRDEKKEVDWKLIVHQRLQAKTKHFTKPQKPVLLENQLSTIAENFFHPLLNSYEKLSKILRLEKDDSYVLGRFIYTLGIIMFSASNTIPCRQMGVALLQFLSTIKSHKDVFVRKAVLFAVAATYTAVPPFLLFSEDMWPEVTHFNEWLQSVAVNDVEGDCVEKALYTLSVCQSAANEVPLLRGLPSFA